MENTLSANSLCQFLKILSGFKGQFSGRFSREAFVFRGMADQSWKLLPGFFREYSEPQKATNGLNAELTGRIYDDNESGMLAQFKKEASGILPQVPQQEELLWMQYAQHYGVPTRLLDFTTNPLVSLYFCCQSKAETDGAIWIVDISNFESWSNNDEYVSWNIPEYTSAMGIRAILSEIHGDPYEGAYPPEPGKYKDRPIYFVPPYIDRRMAAQASRFLIWGKDHRALEDMIKVENWMVLDSEGIAVEKANDERFLAKIIIPSTAKREILDELDLLNINDKSIFPGLDSIGRYVEKYHKRDIDNIGMLF